MLKIFMTMMFNLDSKKIKCFLISINNGYIRLILLFNSRNSFRLYTKIIFNFFYSQKIIYFNIINFKNKIIVFRLIGEYILEIIVN